MLGGVEREGERESERETETEEKKRLIYYKDWHIIMEIKNSKPRTANGIVPV